MKYLTDRHEIAMAMNFGTYPVLHLNRENRPYADMGSGDYAKGCRVRVAWDSNDPKYKGMTTHGDLYIENGRLAISAEGGCLSADFGYTDVMQSVQEANAVVVHRGQAVVVVEDWPSKRQCTVRMMKVSDRIDIHCMTVTHLEDIEEGAEDQK